MLLDLGHTGIFEALIKKADLNAGARADLFSMLQRKSTPDIAALLAGVDCSAQIKQALLTLVSLHGSSEVLAKARQQLGIGGVCLTV